MHFSFYMNYIMNSRFHYAPPDIYIKSIMKLTLQQAELVATNYQSLKGKIFMHPLYGRCDIDFVENFKLNDGSYTVVLKNNIYKEPSITEIYGYKMPMYDLFLFLKINGISFSPKKYGIYVDEAV